jgi:hypothetical protein
MTREFQMPNILECGGKRSATPLSSRAASPENGRPASFKSGGAAAAVQDGKRVLNSAFGLRHYLVIMILSLVIA